MDIIKFIEEGTTVPNPNYKKGAKKGLSSIPRLHSDNIEDVKDPTDATARVISEQTYGLTNLRDEANKFSKNKAYINPISSQEELEYERAKNQPLMTQFGHMLGQALGNEIILGTVRGFSDLFDAAVNDFSDKNDYTNPVSRTIEDWQSYVRDELLPIYQKQNDEGFHINDFGWWMNGLTSAATTVSLMVPGMAVSKGAGLIGKIGNIGGKAGKLARKGVRVLSGGKNTGRIYHTLKGGAEIGTMAFVSRTAENYQEAREVYKNVYDKSLSELTNMNSEQREKLLTRNPEFQGLSDNEIAEQIASVSAGNTFANDYWMLLMDVPQFKALSPIWKGAGTASKATTRALRKANRAEIAKLTGKTTAQVAAEEVAKKNAKGDILERIGSGIKNVWTSTEGLMLGEGVEEGFQGIQTQRGEEIGKQYFNSLLTKKQLGDYLTDESIWEQAFWGVMGGLLFQGAAAGFRKIGDRINAKNELDKLPDEIKKKIKSGELTDERIKALAMGENKARAEEIYGRFKLMDDLNDKMQEINNGYNPFRYATDENGRLILSEDGKPQYELIKDVDEAERLKSVALDDFLTNFTLNAVDNGNYELLKDFVSNPEFSKKFEEQGVETDKLLESQILDKMNEIKTVYENSYYDIIDNTDAYNDYITRLATRKITRKKLEIDSIDERIDNLNTNINTVGLSDVSHYEKIAMQRVIREKIRNIDEALNNLEQNYNKRDNLYSKQAYKKESNMLKKQKARLFDKLNKINPLFDISGFKNDDINKMLADAQEYYDNFIQTNLNTTTSFENLGDSVQKDLYAKSNYELYKEDLQDELPQTDNTKDYYTELYNDTEAELANLAQSKFNDAFETIQEYISKQENPVEAIENILKDGSNDINLQNALDILQFGAYNRQQYNNMLAMLLNMEVTKREKTAENKAEVEGEKVSEPVAETIKEKADEIQSSFTGEEENTPTPPVKENVVVDDDTSSYTANEDENDYHLDDDQSFYQIPEEAKDNANIYYITTAHDSARKVQRNNQSLFAKVLNEGINSQAYQDYLALVKSDMIETGCTPENAEKGAELGIRLMIDLAITTSKRSGIPFKNYDPIKVQELLSSISKALGIDENTLSSEYVSSESQESEAEKGKNVKDIFDKYCAAFNITKSQFDDTTIIDLKELFKEFTNICDNEGMTYNSLLAIYKDMATFVNSYKGREYRFLHKNFLNKNYNDFLNNLYVVKTEQNVPSPFTHFASSLGDDESTKKEKLTQGKEPRYGNSTVSDLTDKAKIHIINYARQNGIELKIVKNEKGKDASVGFGTVYKGKYYELGYISLVTKDKDNKTFTKELTYFDFNGQPYHPKLILTKEGEDIISNQDKYFYGITNDNKLYNTVAGFFVRRYPAHFYTEDGNAAFSEKYQKNPKTKEILEFLNNPLIKEFTSDNGINYSFNEDSLDTDYLSVFNKVCKRISNILFFQINNKTIENDDAINVITSQDGLETSYNTYKQKMYENFQQTINIYDKLKQAEKEQGINAIIRGKLMSDDAGKINFDNSKQTNANKLGIKKDIKKHPFVYAVTNDIFIDENGKQYKGIAGLKVGSVGIVMGVNQGDRRIKDDNTVYSLPGVNLALITGQNFVEQSSQALSSKVNTYINTAISDYFNILSDRSASKEEKDASFNKLYNTLNNLFGNTSSKAFSNFFVVMDQSGDRFSLCKGEKNSWGAIANFVRYPSLRKENGVYKNKQGKIITGNELLKYYNPSAFVSLPSENDEEENQKANAVFSLEKEDKRKVIYDLVNYITKNMTFNTTRFAIDKLRNIRTNSEHIKTDDKGKIYIKVDDYETEHFDSFVEMVVGLNMYKFSQAGARYDNVYKYDTLPNSFFLDIGEAPVSSEELRQEMVLTNWIEENDIKDNQEVKTNDILNHLNTNTKRLTKDEVNSIKELNESIKEQNGVPLFTETVRINCDIGEDFAQYEKGVVKIGKKGVNLANTRPEEMIRLLIHENVHRIVKEQKFFEGEEGVRRLKEFREIFNKFYNTLANENTEGLQDFKQHYLETFNDIISKYSEKPKVLIDEFIAEIISDQNLRSYLNGITIDEEISIRDIDKSNETLLQRILRLLAELFNFRKEISDNTLLAKFYTSLNDVQLGTKSSTTSYNVTETAKGTIGISPVEETPAQDNHTEPGTEPVEETEEQAAAPQTGRTYEFDTNDELFAKLNNIDINSLSSRYESYDDIIISHFEDSDRTDNPNGIISVPDMKTFISIFPSDEKAAMQSELATGRIKYACR